MHGRVVFVQIEVAFIKVFMRPFQLLLQGHALFTRQAGSAQPCPVLDFTGGFNKFFGAAYGLPPTQTIAQKFGAPFGEIS